MKHQTKVLKHREELRQTPETSTTEVGGEGNHLYYSNVLLFVILSSLSSGSQESVFAKPVFRI